MMQRENEELLNDILQAIDTIYNVQKLLNKYPSDELIPMVAYNATLYSLITIGEAINQLDRGFKSRHTQINWRIMVELRNRLAHQYYEINGDYIDLLVEEYLFNFGEQVKKILAI